MSDCPTGPTNFDSTDHVIWINYCTCIYQYFYTCLTMICRKEPVVSAEDWECSALTGSPRTLHTNSTKLSWWIPSTRPSVTTPRFNGSADPYTSTENFVDLPLPARSPGDWARVIHLPRPSVALAGPTGRRIIPSVSVESVNFLSFFSAFFFSISFFFTCPCHLCMD